MSDTDDKIQIIDEIVKRHPSNGISRGWSYYVGGMKDTGEWYFRIMLNENKEVLRQFLQSLIDEESSPPSPPLDQKEAAIKFHRDIERRLMFGK